MNAKAESTTSALDTFKLILAVALGLSGIAVYYLYSELPIYVRVGAVLLGIAAAIAMALQSAQGQEFWHFVQGARTELRKVVWPNRQETVQTTIAVIIFTIVMGVFFWLLDMLLLWATRTLTGQGG